jgi:hypothetical protein
VLLNGLLTVKTQEMSVKKMLALAQVASAD